MSMQIVCASCPVGDYITARQQDQARISELELARKTLETALKHSADLCTELQRQRDAVLDLVDDRQPATVPTWLRDDIRKIYAGEARS